MDALRTWRHVVKQQGECRRTQRNGRNELSFLGKLAWKKLAENFGGPGRDRTDDLFHAMEARSQLRHRPTFRKDSADQHAILILSHVKSRVKPRGSHLPERLCHCCPLAHSSASNYLREQTCRFRPQPSSSGPENVHATPNSLGSAVCLSVYRLGARSRSNLGEHAEPRRSAADGQLLDDVGAFRA